MCSSTRGAGGRGTRLTWYTRGVLPPRIGRYEVLGELASGGMAEILLARISGPGDFKRAVVIKRILRSYASNASFGRMFLDEARIVAALRHPNVVHVQELGEEDGEPYLVMEYVEGENASSLLKRTVASGQPLDTHLAAHIVAECCAGLHAAHELVDDAGRPQNLVHRDVSPQNVLVTYDGHIKLVDFGIALVDDKTTRTEPGEIKGKFDYMSPEQMLGKPLDRRSDVFSLGAVLYELSTGRRLFKRRSLSKTVEAITRDPIVPPSRVITGFSPALEAVIMRALSRECDARYASAAELRKDLLEIVRELSSPVEVLAARMRLLFADRIVEKGEMLRRVGAGDELSHVPAGETDDGLEVPMAPDATMVDATPVPFAVGRKPRARTLAMAGAGVLFVAIGVAAAVVLTRPDVRSEAPVAPAEPAQPVSATVIVRVESKPPGAHVLVGGQDRGETPLALELQRGPSQIAIELRRPGYASVAQLVVPDAEQKLVVALTPKPARRRPGGRTSPRSHATVPSANPHPAAAASPGFRRFD